MVNPPDVGFKVFELIDDKYNAFYNKTLNEDSQGDLVSENRNDIKETDSMTILSNLMLGSKVTLDSAYETIIKDKLYRIEDKLFILQEFELDIKLFEGINAVIVYGRNINSDSFIANLTALVNKDNVIMKS